MVTNVLISGVEYRALNDYQIKQQAGAVGTLSITVDRVCTDGTVRPIPISQQSAIIKIDGATVASGIIQKVTGGQYETGYEPMLFKLDIQSFEAVLNRRLVKHNFYSTTTPTISDIVLWIYNNILAEEGFSLGKISATSEYIRSYKKNYEKVSDVLDDLAGRIDGCSWYITPEKAFYFLIADDFPTVATPTHITDIEYSEASGDLRTVQTVVGASSRITGTEDNPELIASIAILSGTSGKIEVSESDSTIHNDNDALSSAQKKIEQYGERERTVTLTCNDLTASALYNTWTFEPGLNNKLPAEIEGDFVVTDRTISVQGDRLDINVTLKNRNYFCRYGYTYKKFQRSGKDIGDAISDIYSDNKLTPVEKITTRQRWEQAVVEKSTLDEKANFYGVSPADYDAAFQSVADYLNGGIKWVYGYPAWITDDALSETTDYDLQEYSSKWNDYEAGKSECLSSISNAQLAVLQNDLNAVRNGDLVDGAIDRAKLEAGFVGEHEALIDEVGVIKPLNEQLVQTIYPYGTQRQSLPELQGMEILEIEGIANALDHAIIDRDEFFVFTDNRFELLFKDVSDAQTLLTSLEIVPGQITAITEQLSDQEAALASLKILPGEIDAVSTQVTDHGQRIGSLEVGYDEINSILADLEVGGEIINLSLMLQNASRIEAIVADGGYIDENDVFHPTKAYTDVQQLADRFQIFVQGSGSDAASVSSWLVTKDEISQFITDQEVNELFGPVTSQLSTIDQTAEQISLQVSQLEGGLTWRDYATREAYLAALEALEAESTSGLIVAANRITLEVENRQNADTTLSGQITVQSDRITAETIRASGEEVELAGLINVQADRITAVVLDYQNADEELSAQLEIEAGRITAEVTRAIAAEDNLSSTLSSSIQMQADRITAEVTRATGQEATLLSQINMQADRITAAVADYKSADNSLTAAIQVQADRISSEVTRATGQEATLQSNITQQADRITAEITDRQNADSTLDASILVQAGRISTEITDRQTAVSALNSQLVQQANSIAARIQAKTYNPNTGLYETATEAFMALQVKLPETMSAERRAAIVALLTSQELEIFDRIYSAYQASYYSSGSPFSETRYRLDAEATQEDLDAMTSIFKAKGLLSSQFLVDADEILMNGTIRGEKLEMDSVSTNVFEAIQARIQDLTAKKLKVDTDEASQLDFEVQIDDGAGIQVKKNGLVIFGIDPTTGNAYFVGNADIQNGIFRGSIEAGPLLLNKNPPATNSFTISGGIINFLMNVLNNGLTSGTFACSGTYNGININRISFNLSSATQEFSYEYRWYGIYSSSYSEIIFIYYTDILHRTQITYSGSITLYRADNGQAIFSASDTYSPASNWALFSSSSFLSDDEDIHWSNNYPNDSPASGGTVNFNANGTISFTAGAYTYRLVNLPAGYSDSYLSGTVYYDANGALKIKV